MTVNRALASPAVVAIGDHWTERHATPRARTAWSTDDRALLYTSRSLLDIERRLLDQLAGGASAGVGVLDATSSRLRSPRRRSGDDQAEAVRRLTSQRATGRRAGRPSGHRQDPHARHRPQTLRSGRLGGRRPRSVRRGLHASCRTVPASHRRRSPVTASSTARSPPRPLVVIDEAAMAGTRDIAAVVDQATAVGAKVMLVGDHHQLPEVAAGGAFRAALDTLGDRVVELTTNRRQVTMGTRRAGRAALRRRHDRLRRLPRTRPGRHQRPARGPPRHRLGRLARQPRRSGATPCCSPAPAAEARLLNRHARSMLAARGRTRHLRRARTSPTGRSPSATRSCCAGTIPTNTSPTARPSPSTTACAASSPTVTAST